MCLKNGTWSNKIGAQKNLSRLLIKKTDNDQQEKNKKLCMYIQEMQSSKGATCPLSKKDELSISPGRKGESTMTLIK